MEWVGTAFRNLCLAFHHLKLSLHCLVSWFSGKSLQLLPPEVRFYSLNALNSISAGASHNTLLGELTLTALPQTPSMEIKGPASMRREGKENGGEGKKRKGMEGEGVGGEGRGGYVEFYHLLLSDLTTVHNAMISDLGSVSCTLLTSLAQW